LSPFLISTEHIDNLRQIPSCQAVEEHDESPISSVVHWKSKCLELEEEKRRLKDEILYLKTLSVSVDKDDNLPTNKRKGASRHQHKANMQTKRTKHDPVPRRSHPLTDGDSQFYAADKIEDPGRLYQDSLLSPLLTVTGIQRFLLHMADLRSSFDQTLDPESRRPRGQSFALLCDSIYDVAQRRPDEVVERFSTAYAMMLRYCSTAESGDSAKGISLSPQQSIVHLFQRVLSHFHQVALNEVVRKERAERAPTGRTKRNTVAVESAANLDQAGSKHLTALARMLTIMLTGIGLSLNHPDKLLESLLSLLLDHLGSVLSFFVFADPTGRVDDIAPVTGVIDTVGLDHASVMKTGQLSAPYLIGILSAALHACRRDGEATSAMGPWRDAPISLSNEVQVKLQKTLIRGMFGDEDEYLVGAFAAPEVLNEDDFQRIVSDARKPSDDGPWFVAQMWQLLGWDILSKRTSPLLARH
jgi:hypothetical protein